MIARWGAGFCSHVSLRPKARAIAVLATWSSCARWRPLGPMTLTAGDGLASDGPARRANEGPGDPLAGFLALAGGCRKAFWGRGRPF
jgi:hypothetical protein